MPLYEYQCTACRKLTERRQKFSDPELTECPYCGGRLERTITAPAVQFKGGGWYADLYSSGKKAAAPAAEGSANGESSSSGDSAGTKANETSSPAASTTAAAPATSTPASSSTTTSSS